MIISRHTIRAIQPGLLKVNRSEHKTLFLHIDSKKKAAPQEAHAELGMLPCKRADLGLPLSEKEVTLLRFCTQ